MRKKVIIIICILLIIALIVVASKIIMDKKTKVDNNVTNDNIVYTNSINVNNNSSTIAEIKDIQLVVLEDTVTSTNMTVEIRNQTSYEVSYDNYYKIERKDNGSWNELSIKGDSITTDIAFLLKEESSSQKKIDWTNQYGSLEKGEYRITKKVYLMTKERDIEEVEIMDEFNI